MFNEQSSCVAVIRNGGIVPIPLLRLDSPRSPTNETTTISHSHLVLHGLFCYLLLGTEILKFIITCTHVRKLEAVLGIGILKSSGNI